MLEFTRERSTVSKVVCILRVFTAQKSLCIGQCFVFMKEYVKHVQIYELSDFIRSNNAADERALPYSVARCTIM
jgi:hypothetical protein